MEDAIEKFSIFGGVNWGTIDTSKPTFELIEQLILDDYTYIRNDIQELTSGLPLYHTILTAIALGDGKKHAIYKRARITQDVGDTAIEDLLQRGVIYKKQYIADGEAHFAFNLPFVRFWFAFVSPLFQGIKEHNYKEVQQRWENREQEWYLNTFKELSLALTQTTHYITKDLFIDLYKQERDGSVTLGVVKYTNTKVKKSELTQLHLVAQKLHLQSVNFIIVSKKGFSNELKAHKGQQLQLMTLKHFKALV